MSDKSNTPQTWKIGDKAIGYAEYGKKLTIIVGLVVANEAGCIEIEDFYCFRDSVYVFRHDMVRPRKAGERSLKLFITPPVMELMTLSRKKAYQLLEKNWISASVGDSYKYPPLGYDDYNGNLVLTELGLEELKQRRVSSSNRTEQKLKPAF